MLFRSQLVAEYRATYAWLAPLPHVATLLLLYAILRHGQRARKAFTLYFLITYTWGVIFVGGWFSVQLYRRLGLPALGMYGATPILLLLILYQWAQELRTPRLDLDFTRFDKARLLIAVPALIWGFWYPPYEWGIGLTFDPRELLFGAYGLMGCPTTMVPLSILFLKYPAGNHGLFYALTAYAVCIGAAMVALRYLPDIPFFFLGLASLGLVIWTQSRQGGKANRITRVTPVLLMLFLAAGSFACTLSEGPQPQYGKDYNDARRELGIPPIPKDWTLDRVLTDESRWVNPERSEKQDQRIPVHWGKVVYYRGGTLIWETDTYFGAEDYTNEEGIYRERLRATYYYQIDDYDYRERLGWSIELYDQDKPWGEEIDLQTAEETLTAWGIERLSEKYRSSPEVEGKHESKSRP